MDIKAMLKNKSVKYGSYSAALTAIIIVIAIIVTLISDSLVSKFNVKLDLSQNKIYEISAQTKEILKGLDKDIVIYQLISGISTVKEIDELLDNYKKETNRLSVQYIDTNKTPGFEQKYIKGGDELSLGDYIVECGDKYKIVNLSGLSQSVGDNSRYLVAEQKFTSAVNYVISEEDVTIAFTKGHGEVYDQLPIKEILEDQNYKTSDINLLTDEIDETVGTIAIIAPSRDFDEKEIVKLIDYVDKGKSLIYMATISDTPLPNLDGYLKEWGIQVNRDYIIEEDKNHYMNVQGLGRLMIPEILSHDITKKIGGINFLTYANRSITTIETPGITTNVLLETTSLAYAKVNLNAQTSAKEAGDTFGPFNAATISTKQIYNSGSGSYSQSSLLTVGSIHWLDFVQVTQYANGDFLINSVNYMNNKGDTVSVPPKSLSTPRLTVNETQINTINIINFAVVPLIVFLIGLFIWFRRRSL